MNVPGLVDPWLVVGSTDGATLLAAGGSDAADDAGGAADDSACLLSWRYMAVKSTV